METVKIILLCVLAAVIYGIVHDQITARVCVEYFTIGHPPIFHTDSPTLLGLGWGVIATWWVGAFLGVLVAAAARLGSSPKLTAARLIRPIAVLMAVSAVAALVSGISGYFTAKARGPDLPAWLATTMPPETLNRFQADLWAHLASYTVGFLGGIIICVWVLVRRAQKTRGTPRLKSANTPSA